jgi:hypothetical protein
VILSFSLTRKLLPGTPVYIKDQMIGVVKEYSKKDMTVNIQVRNAIFQYDLTVFKEKHSGIELC